MIKLENVNKYFNHHKKNEIHVINNTTLTFAKTGLVALLGPSGCGKTTLLNVIGGLDKINNGKIFVDGKRITKKSSNYIDKTRNLNIGYIFQNYNLLEDKTVFDNVAISLKMVGIKDKNEIRKRVNYVLETLGIYRYRNRIASMLSGGERQRVGIARAIVKNPNVILADEPTGNLDSANTIETMNIIKSISKNRLVILVTHERDIAKFYADRIIEVEDGVIKDDYENNHNDDLDYRIDNKLYLKDFKYNYNLKDNNNNIQIYNESSSKISLTIVVKKNNIYISGPKNSMIEVVDDNSNIELINDHYKKIDKTIYEKYEFDFDKVIDKNINLKYSSIVNTFTLFFQGLKKIRDYSFLKKLLLIGFIISGFFIFFSISSMFGITRVEKANFIQKYHDYYDVDAYKISDKKYNEIKNLSSVDYIIPGDSKVMFSMRFDDFYQTQSSFYSLKGSLVSLELLNNNDIIYGREATNKYEIVIDKFIITDQLKEYGYEVGLENDKDYIGRKVHLKNMNDFTIVGITDNEEPVIYADRSIINDMIYNTYTDYTIYDDIYSTEDSDTETLVLRDYTLEDNLVLKKGSLPVNDYEVIVNINNEYNYPLNKQIKNKVNGKKLTVVGYYESNTVNDYITNYNTITYLLLSTSKVLTIMPKDSSSIVEEVNSLSFNITNSFENSKNAYIKGRQNFVRSTLIVSSVFMIISFVEIYLIVRSSFLTRIKEVGIYRAIGVKKLDICKMFYGEIIAITTLGSIPGCLFASYALKVLSVISSIKSQYMVNAFTLVFSILVIYIFNVIIGLLPVIKVLKQTPAQILSRKDLD